MLLESIFNPGAKISYYIKWGHKNIDSINYKKEIRIDIEIQTNVFINIEWII
jgi:hypothetical protein